VRKSFPFLFLPFIALSCTVPQAVRFPDRAFPTQPNQKVVITTRRGNTEITGVIGSRDILVRGTVRTRPTSPDTAARRAEAVKVIDTSVSQGEGQVLRLDVTGMSSSGGMLLDTAFFVPKDIQLEVHDGPEDLTIRGLDRGVTIVDGAGDIDLQEINGPVEIEDQDGNIHYLTGKGAVKVVDRRGNVIIEEVTGNIDLEDREGDALIQSITGDVVLAKRGRGTVRIYNVDGNCHIREWDNPTQPIIDTIWPQDGKGSGEPRAASMKENQEPKAPPPQTGPASKKDAK